MKSLKENFQKGHIVIIGSGIIGKFNSLELSELGFQVTIIDPTQIQNSSNAALGLLMGNIYQKRRGRGCLLYTSPSPRDPKTSRMPSSA